MMRQAAWPKRCISEFRTAPVSLNAFGRTWRSVIRQPKSISVFGLANDVSLSCWFNFKLNTKRAVLYSLRATFEIMPTEVDLVPLILIFVEVDFVFLHHPTRRLRCNTVRCDHITGNGHWIEHIWVLCAHYEPVTSVLCINTAHIN